MSNTDFSCSVPRYPVHHISQFSRLWTLPVSSVTVSRAQVWQYQAGVTAWLLENLLSTYMLRFLSLNTALRSRRISYKYC
jgi:hypothetical protein